MDSIVMLINEIPWVMAPASLVAGLLVASLIKAAIQFTEKSFSFLGSRIVGRFFDKGGNSVH